MKRWMFPALAALAAVLVALWVLMPDAVEDEGQANATGPSSASGEDFRALERRVAALEGEVEALKGQLDDRRAARAGGRGAGEPGGGPGEAGGAFDEGPRGDEAGGLAVGGVGSIDEDDPDAREKVQTIVRDELEIAREEEWQERRTAMKARVEERVGRFAQEANLSQSQEKELSALIVSERERIMENFREARRTFTFDEAREKAEAIRAETDAEAEKILDKEQLKLYREQREEESERWGGGRGPGGGWGGGGPGGGGGGGGVR